MSQSVTKPINVTHGQWKHRMSIENNVVWIDNRWKSKTLMMAGILFLWVAVAVVPAGGGTVVDRVMAIVNDEIISLYELNQRILPFTKKLNAGSASAEDREALFQRLTEENLNLLINEKLADQEIKRLNIKVSETEINREIERIKSVNQLTDQTFLDALSAEERNMDDFRQQVKEQILRARLVNREIRSKIVITTEDVKSFYQTNPEEFGGEIIYFLKNIVVEQTSSELSADRAEIVNRLERILGELSQGKAFDGLARQYSDAPNAINGGSLGFIKKSALAPQIQAALAPLSAGQYTKSIETDQGYQIFYIEKIEMDAAKPFDEVRPQIEDKLYNQVVDQQYEKWLKKLRSRAHIKLFQ